jgi:hypothetical protein
METSRIIVLGSVGAFIASVVLGQYADYDKALRETRIKAIDNFLVSSNEYTASAPGFCRGDAETLRSFESTVVNDYHASRLRVRLYYPDDQKLVTLLDMSKKKEETLFNTCHTVEAPRPPQTTWEPMREELQKANNDIVRVALDHIKTLF